MNITQKTHQQHHRPHFRILFDCFLLASTLHSHITHSHLNDCDFLCFDLLVIVFHPANQQLSAFFSLVLVVVVLLHNQSTQFCSCFSSNNPWKSIVKVYSRFFFFGLFISFWPLQSKVEMWCRLISYKLASFSSKTWSIQSLPTETNKRTTISFLIVIKVEKTHLHATQFNFFFR